MQMKKDVLRKRLQVKLDKLTKEKQEHDAQWPAYQKALAEYYESVAKAVQGASGFDNLNEITYAKRPEEPKLHWDHADSVRRVKRNMEILDALDGETIEVEKLRTGRNFTIESIFDSEFWRFAPCFRVGHGEVH